MNKAFFFDRDGVINYSVNRFEKEYNRVIGGAPLRLEELKFKPNIKNVFDYVRENGFIPIIVTNQPDWIKKKLLINEYERITTKICETLKINRSQLFECFHKEGYSLECLCRKPKSGLFLMAKGLYDLDLNKSWIVGDSWKDIMAAHNAGILNSLFFQDSSKDNSLIRYKKDLDILKENSISIKKIILDINEILEIDFK